ncbi:MAG: polysaccharide biosynthesis tyrosine autokinase [Stenomitos rutilans HA7619-LM2]|jgi:capsular exopolysaccharide synthesis family protein|nr:polysaccharide biosynthesis tyrosine autokinase [Stenomitos rutilans HA7619-LM2]
MKAEQYTHGSSFNDQERGYTNGALSEDTADLSARPAGLDLSPIVRMIQRNALLIAGVTAAGAALVAYSSLSGPRTYKGHFQLLVEPITTQARLSDPAAISRPGAQQPDVIDYPTLLQILQSPELLSKIATEIQRRYPDVTASSLAAAASNKTLVIKRYEVLAQRFGSDASDPTKVIDVSYKGQDPQKVEFILQELARGYLRYSLEDRKTRIGGGVQFIEDQLPSLQRRVNDLEGELQALRQRYRIADPTTEGTQLSTQAQNVQAQQLETQRNFKEQQALFGRLQAQLGISPEQALAAASLSENTSYQTQVAELKKVQTAIAEKSARYSSESPVIVSLKQQEAKLEQLLNREARKSLGLTDPNAPIDARVLAFQNALRVDLIRQLVTAANTAQQLRVRGQAIAESQAFLNQKLQEFPVVVRQYTGLSQRLDLARTTLNQFLTQRETLRIEAAQKEVPWEIVSAPTIDRDGKNNPIPSASIEPKFLIAGLGACLLLGLAAALLKEKARDRFYSAEDMEGALKLPLLGTIPFKSGLNQPTVSLPTARSDAFAKAFSSLYTNIRFLSPKGSVRSLVIGSAESGDGKTTIALHLALEAASMGQRVLLVDTNLRAPQLHSMFSLPNTIGLSELITNKAEIEQAIQRAPVDHNLSVLTSGQTSPDSGKLLASNEMQGLMQALQDKFDLVIYDTAALSEFSDANFVAAQSSGMLMVAGVSKTKRSVLTQILAELNRFRLPILGFVPNHPGRGTANSFSQSGQFGQNYGGKPTLLGNFKLLKPNE